MEHPTNPTGAFEALALLAHGGEQDAEAIIARVLALLGDELTRGVNPLPALTTHEQAEAALRAGEERFRIYTGHATDMVLIVRPDSTIVYASPSHRAILGYKPEKMIGHRAIAFLHPDDIPKAAPAWARLISQPDTVQSAEFRLRHANGSWATLEARAVNRLHDSTVRGLVMNNRDITMRKRLGEAFLADEERFRRLAAVAPIGICILDEQDHVEVANTAYCALIGCSEEDLIGRSHADLLGEEHGVAWHACFALAATGEPQGPSASTLPTRQGQPRSVRYMNISLTGADGRPRRAVFVVDTSARTPAG